MGRQAGKGELGILDELRLGQAGGVGQLDCATRSIRARLASVAW